MRHYFVIIFLLSLTSSSPKFFTLDMDLNINEYDYDVSAQLDANTSIIATSNFTDELNTTGWTFYSVNVSGEVSDWLQGYAMGYVEGYATAEMIYNVWNNQYIRYLTNVPPQVWSWINNQTTWIQQNIAANPTDPYWDLVNTTMNILYGMYDGYMISNVRKNKLTHALNFQQFYTITYLSDLFDVMALYTEGHVSMAPQRCSYLLRLGKDDLLTSHDSWFDYIGLLKIYKIYNFTFSNPMVTSEFLAYSAQPGSVPSQDDFYVLDNNVTIAETSLENKNADAYSFLNSDSVPYWIRVTVANLAYKNQEQWASTYFQYRSGTYNNQWMVVDYNEYFRYSSKNLYKAANIIWIIEEFFNYTSQIDVTQTLLVQNGYVAGYNVAYNQTIANYSMNPDTYTNASRYYLFLKYAPEIQEIHLMETVMRLNNISDTGSYGNAIAPRNDLEKNCVFPNGAIDSKIVNSTTIIELGAEIVCGPTTEDKLPTFSWKDWPQYANCSVGMPTEYTFDWVYIALKYKHKKKKADLETDFNVDI